MPKRDKFAFKFSDEWYTVQGAETALHGDKSNLSAMKEEYTRMRDVAQKRLKRLGDSFSESKAYREHRDGFLKISEIDPRDLPKAFSDIAKFLKAKASSASGQRDIRRKTIETWQEQGLNLNQKNYDKAIRILEELRKRKLVYGSDKVVELADSMLELDDQQTEQWLDHLDTLMEHTDELQEIDDVAGYEFDDIIRMLGE